MEETARLRGVDCLKGIAIVGVVFTHLVILSGVNREGGDQMPLFLQILYLGLMSFFIITGYFFKPGRGFVRNIKSRAALLVALLICAIALPVILFIWATLFGQSPGLEGLLEGLMQSFSFQGSFEDISYVLNSPLACGAIGYYYLWAMLIGYVVFFALADKIYGDWRKEVATIGALLVIQCLYIEFIHLRLPFSAQLVPISTAFMFLGMMLSERRVLQRIEELRYSKVKNWIPFLICLVAGVVLAFLFNPDVSFDKCLFGAYGGYSVFPYFVEASLFFIVFLYIMTLISRIPILSVPFLEMGRHTLGTILLHAFVAKMLVMPFYTFDGGLLPTMPLWAKITVALITLVLCYTICTYGPCILSRMRNTNEA